MEKMYDVVGIGNSLLDLTFNVGNDFLEKHGLKKGTMCLVDVNQSKSILQEITSSNISGRIFPGGSVSNTLAGVSALGGKTLFIGKIGKDENGKLYKTKTEEENVVAKLSGHETESTGHAITLITPDHERTFAVHLGASIHLGKEDIFEEDVVKSKILHLESYQLENAELRYNILYAVEIAKKNNVLVSLDLSDSELVARNKKFLEDFVSKNIDILFSNEDEARIFTGKEETDALDSIYEMCELAVVKLGEKGSFIKYKDRVHKIDSFKVDTVNTNGAGDIYAAGILHGLINGLNMDVAGKLASYAAALVVSNEGARLNSEQKRKVKLLNGEDEQ